MVKPCDIAIPDCVDLSKPENQDKFNPISLTRFIWTSTPQTLNSTLRIKTSKSSKKSKTLTNFYMWIRLLQVLFIFIWRIIILRLIIGLPVCLTACRIRME
jgi:hypothetical protein